MSEIRSRSESPQNAVEKRLWYYTLRSNRVLAEVSPERSPMGSGWRESCVHRSRTPKGLPSKPCGMEEDSSRKEQSSRKRGQSSLGTLGAVYS